MSYKTEWQIMHPEYTKDKQWVQLKKSANDLQCLFEFPVRGSTYLLVNESYMNIKFETLYQVFEVKDFRQERADDRMWCAHSVKKECSSTCTFVVKSPRFPPHRGQKTNALNSNTKSAQKWSLILYIPACSYLSIKN